MRFKGGWSLVACCVVLLGCEVSHEAGSDCENDECPDAPGQKDPPCVVHESSATIHVIGMDEYSTDGPNISFCTSVAADATNGANCQLYWGFNEPTLVGSETVDGCDQLPFLEDVDESQPGIAEFKSSTEVAHVCRVKKVSNDADDAGWRVATTLPGGRTESMCFELTENTAIPNAFYALGTCSGSQAIARDGSLVDTKPQLCSLPANSAKHASSVGKACEFSAIPEGGFHDSAVYIETNSEQCDTGACIAYHLDGDPTCDAGKNMSCGSGRNPVVESEAAKRMYCSCRCDAPEGDPGDLCECGAGYTCTPALYDGPPGVRGSYCVKNGTISTF